MEVETQLVQPLKVEGPLVQPLNYRLPRVRTVSPLLLGPAMYNVTGRLGGRVVLPCRSDSGLGNTNYINFGLHRSDI